MAPSGGVRGLNILLIYLWIKGSVILTEAYSETYWQSPLQVVEYKSYRSVRILEYAVPVQTSHVTWTFNGLTSEEGCDERTVEIAIQQGSFPVITPHNETFPPNFNIYRTGLQLFRLSTNGTRFTIVMDNPLPGSWYAAMYLADKSDERIKQKGFGRSCQYFLGSIQEVFVITHIPELETNVPVDISNHEKILFRFFANDLTWKYTILITKCTFKPTVLRESYNTNSSAMECPLMVAVRGQALAGLDEDSSHLNCSKTWNGENCSMVVTSPVANAWQYLMILSQQSGNLSFTVFIGLSECSRFGSRSGSKPTEGPLTAITPNTTVDYLNSTNTTQASPRKPARTIPFPVPGLGVAGSSDFNDAEDSVRTVKTTENFDNSLPINVTWLKSMDNSSAEGEGEEEEEEKDTEAPESETDNRSVIRDFTKCSRIPQLGRFARSTFDVQYSLRVGNIPFPNQLLVPSDRPLVLAFDVKSVQDTGGTLKYQLRLLKDPRFLSPHLSSVEVVSCIQRARIPMDDQDIRCDQANRLAVSSNGSQLQQVYFPFPEAGTWYITLLSVCYNKSTNASGECRVAVGFGLVLQACVDNGCGPYGRCVLSRDGFYFISVCNCVARWRGYGCTDGSVGDSNSLQLASTLMLSLSNLAFIPAIIVALYRRFYVEALVYAYTMFFSTFYHACDGDSRHTWCMMPYAVLAHCDFFGAILSFWVTLVAMARLAERIRSFLLMLAALALAMGVQWDRHSLWTFLVPAATGLAIMLASWSYRCYKRKMCYPTQNRWLLFIIPGAIIAVTGLITFAFFETDRNYKYTHSVWHTCMAFCVVLILPPRRLADTDESLPMPTTNSPREIACCGCGKREDAHCELLDSHFDSLPLDGYTNVELGNASAQGSPVAGDIGPLGITKNSQTDSSLGPQPQLDALNTGVSIQLRLT